MSIVAPPNPNRNMTPVPSPEALGQLSAAMAQRSALARSLPDTLSESECAAFLQCDAQVQAQIDAWLVELAAADTSA